MFNYEKNLIFWQLLLYGVHIGHRFRNSSLYAGWLIFTYSYETLIINLYKTILGFKNGNLGYDYCCRVGSPIWFLNLNKAFDIYVNESALKCGEFAYTTYWIHGMISNWIYLADQIDQLWHYTEDAHKGQFSKLEMDYSPWFMSRWSWPRAVLISSVHTSEWPSHECLKANIPSVGIIDTNISGHISNIPTPGNDDSLDSMVYYNTNTSQYILEKKYMHVTAWLYHIRAFRRNISFSEWVLSNFFKDNGKYNQRKMFYIIRDREKKNRITDYMNYFVSYKINIMKLWGLGVKFYFGLDSGKTEFQGGLDLYSQNGEKINDRFDIYSLMEKFKQRGVYICKILNFYLLKGLWHSSSSKFVRRKFMGKKWFKYRFLTNNYYAQVKLDDYFRTNFLVNRFWRNRIFKTYLRRSFYRNNIFLLKFFKFYNVYRYNIKRGFMDAFSASYLKVSSFSSVAFSYGFNYFKKHFYVPLLNQSNSFSNLFEIKKFTFLSKWQYFKKEIGSFLHRIIHSDNSTNLKFSSLYRVYAFLKHKLKSYLYMIYAYINFYYSFWYWNRGEYRFIKITRKWHLAKKFRALKNLNKLYFFLELFKKSVFPLIKCQTWFLKNDIDHNTQDLLSHNLARVYALLGLNYRKRYFSTFVNYRNSKLSRIRRYFRKTLRDNKYRERHNKMMRTLQYDYKKFKDTPEVQREVRKLYRKIRKNLLIAYFNKKNHRKLSSKLSFRQFIRCIQGSNSKRFRRLSRYNLWEQEYPGFNFFQVSKRYCHREITPEWLPSVTIRNEIIWDLDDNDDKILPSAFLTIFSQSKHPTHRNILTHNLDYFNKAVLNTTFPKMFNLSNRWRNMKIYKLALKIKKKFKLKDLPQWDFRINHLKKIYKFSQKHKKLIKKIRRHLKKIRRLKFKYKRHIFRAGHKSHRFISGFKFFHSFNYLRWWSFIKKDYFLGNGLNFRMWNLSLNKNYPKRVKKLYKPVYLINHNVDNFTYFFYVRFFSIFHKYISLLKYNVLGSNRSSLLLKKNRVSYYLREKKKTYWS